MTGKRDSFGRLLRDKRVEKGFSLRKFAEAVGVSPTYLSQVEQGNCDPPTASRVRRMAEILGENADELIALAGRVPEDLPGILQKQPARLAAFMREVSDLTPEQLTALSEQARQLKGKETRQRGQTSTSKNHS
jgi:transcriptional regulator with XRE-family HTH domain